jgi:hypothetical protein
MADEIQVRLSISIRKGNLNYQSQPTAFNDDLDGDEGPTPGYFVASTYGTLLDLSALTGQPGWCWMQNLDATNYVEWGIWDHETGKFSPVGELGPGEIAQLKLTRNLGVEYDDSGTGTGTTAPTDSLRFKANGADCKVRVDVFGR